MLFPLQGLSSWHQCQGAECLLCGNVRVQTVVIPLLGYNAGSPSAVEYNEVLIPIYTPFIDLLVPSSVDAVLCLMPLV